MTYTLHSKVTLYMSGMIQIGIVGGAGYAAGELLRILLNHPNADIKYIQSQSQAGKLVSSVHLDLIDECFLKFTTSWSSTVDLIFLCSGHGQSKFFLQDNTISSDIRIIDLSQDFRLAGTNNFKFRKFIYGLPELNRELIKKAHNIANPGCFATAIELALLPIIHSVKDDIHIQAITGSTGSGQTPTQKTHFSWRNNNVSVYKVFTHQHLAEINETLLQKYSDFNSEINFIPVRGNFTRGIFTTLYFKTDLEETSIKSIFRSYYQAEPFVVVTDEALDLKRIINTNKALLSVEKIGDKAFVCCVIDNLLKGASGQAVQNMNIMFGLDETAGLKLKASAF